MFHISSHYIGVSSPHFWTHQISYSWLRPTISIFSQVLVRNGAKSFNPSTDFEAILMGRVQPLTYFHPHSRILQDSLDICGPLSGVQFKWTKWIYFTIIVGVNDLDYIGVKSSLISLLYTSIRAFLSQVSQCLALNPTTIGLWSYHFQW